MMPLPNSIVPSAEKAVGLFSSPGRRFVPADRCIVLARANASSGVNSYSPPPDGAAEAIRGRVSILRLFRRDTTDSPSKKQAECFRSPSEKFQAFSEIFHI